ncbi:MAG: SDR family NAD(P)-dependent oxidoreductase [Gammaproteobacteria bacterium]|nr:SDR family NAD(P)-dependent oxidoreductase [Gammaproteobacteria bacterium]NND38981.1 SDR family NAD(P)-dependent oxidoreductase [Pseudomonadales bacterium]MBT8151754.1 SDR family NAD(P)-dependent oxidoreductase [Gammaproteobacteria bacterium]NNL10637.1 SDR family NAD(P)-dependent oxidoreductase [Pseudomonadales bacterium]NNM10955.1 SDR family NAD(P)-dependent oxidoreductase [Pseudomonadales bacterium]
MQDFKNKVAVITGGASGVGRSLAFSLGKRGAKIVVGDVDKDAMQKIEADLAEADIESVVGFCDVTSRDSLGELAKKAIDKFGGIDLAFANAGISSGESGAMWDYSEKDWQWCFNVNLWGVVNTISVLVPHLLARDGQTHFIVTGSGNGGLIVLPDQPIYTASKAAVQAVTENLHNQMLAGETNVTVSALFPGPHVVETGLFNSGRVRPEEFQKGDGNVNSTGITSVDDLRAMCAEYGIDLKSTHPDEVAEMAVEGIEKDQFWLLKTTPESEAAIKRRADNVLNRITPVPEQLGS